MELTKWYLGCDPGKGGGVVLLNEVGTVLSTYVPKMIGDEIDISDFNLFFNTCKLKAEKENKKLHVVIEEVHSIYGSSASSNFTFGFMVGMLKTLVVTSLLPHTYLQPKEWQKEVWLNSEIEREASKTDVNGKVKQGKILTKITSLKSAMRLFPTVDFRATERSKKPHDGLIDAALIAEAGRRKNH